MQLGKHRADYMFSVLFKIVDGRLVALISSIA